MGRLAVTDARGFGPSTLFGGYLCRAAVALVLVTGGLVGRVPAVAAAAPVTITMAAEAGVRDNFATATLAGGEDPTGTVTFRLYGPGDDSCARPPRFVSTNPVTGAGDPKHATSDRFVLSAPGVYHFVATYSGDVRNAPAGPTECGDPNAAVGFGSSSFAFSAQASGTTMIGGTVSDTATITASFDLAGTMSFALFGPDVTACTGTPVFTSARPVQGNGSYTSDPFVPTTPGIYRWVASYSGDGNPSAVTSCNDPHQQVEVRAYDGSGAGDRCIVPAGPRAVLEERMAALRQLLQAYADHPLGALIARANGQVERALTACRAAMPPG